MQIHEAKALFSVACLLAFTMEDEVEKLCAVIAEHPAQLLVALVVEALPKLLQGPAGLEEPTTITWTCPLRKAG